MKTKEDYKNELLSPMWQERRQQILERDEFRCQKCFNKRYLPSDSLIETFAVKQKVFGNKVAHVIVIPPNKSIPYPSDNPIAESIKSIEKHLRRGGKPAGFLSTFSYSSDESPMFQAVFRINHSQEEPLVPKNDRGETSKPILSPSRSLADIQLIAEHEPLRINWYYVRMLNVHHQYYQIGAMAWEYPDNALTTLCLRCHHEEHAQTKTPVRDQYGHDINQTYTPCDRCGGCGWFSEYRHRDNGICYKCHGARYIELVQLLPS